MEVIGMFLPLIIQLLLIIPIIIGVVLGVRFVKRAEKRADERLAIERENKRFQQEQMQVVDELSQRMIRIEKLLKEVE